MDSLFESRCKIFICLLESIPYSKRTYKVNILYMNLKNQMKTLQDFSLGSNFISIHLGKNNTGRLNIYNDISPELTKEECEWCKDFLGIPHNISEWSLLNDDAAKCAISRAASEQIMDGLK